jgi:hypothetical protein
MLDNIFYCGTMKNEIRLCKNFEVSEFFHTNSMDTDLFEIHFIQLKTYAIC